MIELLAAIPSVVFGLWGVFVLAPFLRGTVEAWIVSVFGWIPFLGRSDLRHRAVHRRGHPDDHDPADDRHDLARGHPAVPDSQREAMLALGATRWETIRRAVLPYARSGIIGAVILGLGRALGETMAVTMVIGNKDAIPTSLFDQTQTIASKIATTFNEAPVGLPDLQPDRPRADPAGDDHDHERDRPPARVARRRPRGRRLMAAATPGPSSAGRPRPAPTAAGRGSTGSCARLRSLAAVACVIPLAAVLIFVTLNGLAALNLDLLTQPSRAPGHRRWRVRAILGTIQMVGAGDPDRDPVRRPGRDLRQRVQLAARRLAASGSPRTCSSACRRSWSASSSSRSSCCRSSSTTRSPAASPWP